MQEKISILLIKKLQAKGHQAYWVGGCVRDILMDVEPNDYDIVTSAKPEEIEKTFSELNIIPVGKQFGVLIAAIKGHNFEIATFRAESKYTDARRPDKVFWTSAEKDAIRRDFTINGLFLDPLVHEKIPTWQLPGIRQMKTTNQGLVIDYTGGIKDIDDKVIRFIGDANERIKEDNLRILRAVRFKNTLKFQYNKETYKAIKNNTHLIKNVSSERINNELNKMFSDPNRAESLKDLDDTGLLKEILPEISRLKGLPQPDIFHKEGDTFEHTYLALKALPPKSPLTLVWATLLHDSGKYDTITFPKDQNDRIRFNKHVKFSAGIASQVAHRLKFPNSERELIVWLVKNHMILADIPKMGIAKQRRWLMDPRFPWLLKLNKADTEGTLPVGLEIYNQNLKLFEQARKLYEEEKKRPQFKPLITGNDLIKVGIKPGPKIGKLLKLIEDAQLEGKIKSKSDAIDLINR